jgi:hypothetical protein
MCLSSLFYDAGPQLADLFQNIPTAQEDNSLSISPQYFKDMATWDRDLGSQEHPCIYLWHSDEHISKSDGTSFFASCN